jgi:hypothetical protein
LNLKTTRTTLQKQPPRSASQCLWTEELVEVLINDGKVEVVKATKVDKSKKAPKAKGKRGIAHLMIAKYRLRTRITAHKQTTSGTRHPAHLLF